MIQTLNVALVSHMWYYMVPLFVGFFAEVQTEAGVNMVAVQADLEEIAFKNRMECSYARNPFSSQRHFQVSTSEDVIQHVTTVRDKNPFCVGTAVRQLPHGHGNLKTVTGKLLYSGKWRKGKHSGYI